jgi:hypothetical protein
MKKVRYLGLVIVVGLVSFNVHIKEEDYYPGIWIGNTEALSQSESRAIQCLGLGSLDCPGSTTKVKYIER